MRSRMLSSIGIATLALSAACSDAATAPQTSSSPSGLDQSSKFLVPVATATVKVVDIYGVQIPYGNTNFEFVVNGDTVFAEDNVSNDLDPAPGAVKVQLPPAVTYTVCAFGSAGPYYAAVGDPTYPTCKTVSPGTLKFDFGSITMRKKPKVTFLLHDMYGNKAPGATMQIVYPNGYELTIAEGMAGMDPVVDGKISTKLGPPGTYTWCETKAPTGFMMANPSCGTIQAQYDVETTIVLKHKSLMVKPIF